jgi:hypothetical protein
MRITARMEIAPANRPATNGIGTSLDPLVLADATPGDSTAGDTVAKIVDVAREVDVGKEVDVVARSPGSRTVYLNSLNPVSTISCQSGHENTAHESVYNYILRTTRRHRGNDCM